MTYTFSDPSIFKLVEDSSKYKGSASVNAQAWTGQDKQFLYACPGKSVLAFPNSWFLGDTTKARIEVSPKKAMAAKFVRICPGLQVIRHMPIGSCFPHHF